MNIKEIKDAARQVLKEIGEEMNKTYTVTIVIKLMFEVENGRR